MKSLCSLIGILLLAGCAYGHTAEECAIYSLVLNNLYVHPQSKLIVIDSKTRDPFGRSYIDLTPHAGRRSALEKITPAAWEDFKLQNTFPSTVETTSLHLRVRTVSADSSSVAVSKVDYWPAFYRKFPSSDGLISLSQVGFDRGSRQAVVYVWRNCGALCADEYVVVLSQTSGSWKIVGKYLAAVS